MQSCEHVQFVTFARNLAGGYDEKLVARTPEEWFDVLAQNETKGLSLRHEASSGAGLPDRISAAFAGGGGGWSIDAIDRDGLTRSWRARWEVGNRDAIDRRIWRVSYGLVGEARPPAIHATVAEIRPSLIRALEDIRAFAAAQQLQNFVFCFQRALDALHSTARFGDYKDLVADGEGDGDRAALLDVCQSAWVFGGMGSWNDLSFEGELGRQYDQVSERLFALLNQTIVAATNEPQAAG
ncbi:MAG TPA: hypothetical protein VII38_06630 [Polyangia bacterium]